ncbi:hypothetical protein GBAR_LOCUS4606 [Geodia barretti]|uniref:Uncharacterized protein n=1 Tax=Geodia barretti TaxID=519541 RepID=A0AA35R7E0_GEOBA|nr:hypothetical protein GBAR_LOCUS4606 [Geodia barretti]
MLRGLANITQRRFATGGNAGRGSPRTARMPRREAMARRREVSIVQMNELYARVVSSHFGYKTNRRRVIESKLLEDADNLEEFDRVMTQGFTSGGVEPLTTALMDPVVAQGLNQQPLTKESFAEFVRDSREYAQDDNFSIAVEVNPSGAADGWEVAGVIIQFLEGYIAKNPREQKEFSNLNDDDRARWVSEAKAIPRSQDFIEKVLEKYHWTEHLGGTLDMFDMKEVLYGPDPITCQDNVAYGFMTGVEPKYQGMSLGGLLFQAHEAQNYAKGIDASIGELTSVSRVLGRTFAWKKHKEVLYKDYMVWRYLTSNGTYHMPPDGKRYSQEEILSKGLVGEHKHAPWADIDWVGPPHYQKTDRIQYKPDLRYPGGWHNGGKRHAIPSVIRGGVAAYKTYPSPLPVLYDENLITSAAPA